MINYLKKSPHRNHLEMYLEKYLPKLSGSILEIGSKNRRYDHLMKEKPTTIDLIENKEKAILIGDISNLQFSESSFQNIVCLEVLEYVDTPEIAIKEIYRVLVKEGTLIMSVPFMYKFHDDQLRYTENYLRKLLSNFQSVEIYSIGNAYSAILNIVFGKIKSIKFSIFRYIATIFYIPFIFFLPRKTSRGGNYASGYFIKALK